MLLKKHVWRRVGNHTKLLPSSSTGRALRSKGLGAVRERRRRSGRVIPRDYITPGREWVPWSEDFQVEEDLIVSRTLIEMFSDPFLAKALAFRGGTAQYKL